MSDKVPPDAFLERLVPYRPLPPYSYVSGKFVHPVRDPRGHSFGMEEAAPTIEGEGDWRHCEAYLWGIDLFNHGYYWESHESWEGVWHAVDRQGVIGNFCKALIKLGAAGVKAREGRPAGVKRHSLRAHQLLSSVAEQIGPGRHRFMGLMLPDLMSSAEELIGAPERIVNTSDEAVVIVMPFSLRTTTT